MFHADGTEYRGAIHEIVHATSETDPLKGTFFSQLSLKHYGYTNEVVASKDKAGRNLALAEAAYATEPGPGTARHGKVPKMQHRPPRCRFSLCSATSARRSVTQSERSTSGVTPS